jgi:WD40 repeat protein
MTGEKLVTCKGHTEGVRSVAWSPDGTRLASLAKGNLKLWDTASGVELLSLGAGDGLSIDWSPDGLRLAEDNGRPPRILDAAGGYRHAGVAGPACMDKVVDPKIPAP